MPTFYPQPSLSCSTYSARLFFTPYSIGYIAKLASVTLDNAFQTAYYNTDATPLDMTQSMIAPCVGETNQSSPFLRDYYQGVKQTDPWSVKHECTLSIVH
jgi:hypothetical protein